MKKEKFDFGGWATKNDLLCADGRTIRKNAFKDDDGRTVPLVYQHNHDDPTRVIGHALLENRDEGVYAYGSLNNTDIAQHVKELIRHGDINGLSIFANKLTQRGGDVIHGTIRELSVVLAGANPGAVIEFPILEHGEESETEAYIWPGDEDGLEMGPDMSLKHEEESEEPKEETEISHADVKEEEKPMEKKEPETVEEKKEDSDETIQDVLDSMNDEQRQVVEYLVGKALEGDEAEEDSDEEEEEVSHTDSGDDRTIQDVLDTMNDKQRKVTEFLVAQALASVEEENNEDEEEGEEEAASHSDEEGEEFTMKENVFDKSTVEDRENDTLTHAQMDMLIKDGKRLGSLKQSVLEHSAEYGIEQIDYLMPEYREVTNGAPEFIKKDQGWVTKVMQGVHHTPFSKIKTTFADLTEEQARARGYLKGHLKKNEVFALLKRPTSPTTIYKKQKLDRDDVIEITDFDVVAWLKSEMRMMLDEEIARAILIGDGRDPSQDDHIDTNCIRPIFLEEELFVVRKPLEVAEGQDPADALIDAVTLAWEDYQGSGNATAFMTRRQLAQLKLLKDKFGRRIYTSEDQIASALGVKEIVCVPQMGDASTVRVDATDDKTYAPAVIIVNLNDYNVGADKGGSVNMFDDFDIDYNQQKYLIETRCSGALVKPFSAIIIETEVEEEEADPLDPGTT